MNVLLWLFALILAFAPGLALMWYIRRLDKYEPEPWRMIGWAFLAGCLSVIPALIIETMLGTEQKGFIASLFSAFVVAALTEELCKGGLAAAFMWWRPQFSEVMDGIVYFGVAHMGFAITENLMYIFVNSHGNLIQALMTGFTRTTTAVPLHVINGMIMGYHLGKFKFAKTPGEKLRNLAQGILIPIALHGVYDLAAFNQSVTDIRDYKDLFAVGFGTALMYAAVVALWMVLLPRIREAQEHSPYKPKEWPTMPVAPTACPNCGAAYPLGANYCHICATPVSQQQQGFYYQQQAPGGQ